MNGKLGRDRCGGWGLKRSDDLLHRRAKVDVDLVLDPDVRSAVAVELGAPMCARCRCTDDRAKPYFLAMATSLTPLAKSVEMSGRRLQRQTVQGRGMKA